VSATTFAESRRRNVEQIAQMLAQPNPVPTVPGADMGAFERYAIVEALRHTGGEMRAAARLLNISIRTLQMRLRQWRGDAPGRW
jgi:DNA-binding NtrC family response regulator